MSVILEKRPYDARRYDILCASLLNSGPVGNATIATVNQMVADQGALVFGQPIVNSVQNIYPDGTIAPPGTVIQVPISGGVIPAGVTQLLCTVHAQFTDSLGNNIDATVLMNLTNTITARGPQ